MIRELRMGEDVDVSSPGLEARAMAVGEAGTRHRLIFNRPVDETGTLFGFATAGGVITKDGWGFALRPGMYFSVPGCCELSVDGPAVVVTRFGYRGLFHTGGPVEPRGRLLYIDGCSDTLLVPPPKLGDPCLNHLHFPGGIRQTMHTHPSARVGVVSAGEGRCVQPAGETPLRAGLCWYLSPGDEHCFYTDPGKTMDVIAWHPDSDCGPTDQSHPMIRKTIVNGVPANEIDAIRTREIV